MLASTGAANLTSQGDILPQLIRLTARMSTWLRLLGIFNIFLSTLWLLSIIATLFCWIPLWQGILLYRSANRSRSFAENENWENILQLLHQLHLYFLISGILTLVLCAFTIALILMVWLFPETGDRLPQLLQYY